jgi:flavin-dependent dehydrogenase
MRWDFDVAIVGGGPAGSSTAIHLARKNGVDPARVLVLDRAKHPREKPCAGAVSAWGLRALEAVGVALAVPRVPMRGVRILCGSEVGTCTDEELGVVVRRSEFDASLFEEAARAGVACFDGEGVVRLERVYEGWRVETTRRAVTARLVAACDGAGSTVRKLLALGEPARKGHLYVLESPPTDADVGPREGLCDFDLTPCAEGIEGYYWDFPTVIAGAPAVSRGIYNANLTRGARVKEALGRALARRGVDMRKVTLKPFSTRPFVSRSRLSIDRVALVGEAAGIDATTGEGIAQAILFGEIAARHLAAALASDHGDLRGYDAEVQRSRVARHLLQSAWLAPMVYGRGGDVWRSFLVRSHAARVAGVRWYKGDPLSIATKAGLALGLAREGVEALLGRGGGQKPPLERPGSSSPSLPTISG